MGLKYTFILIPSHEDIMEKLEGIGFEDTTEIFKQYCKFDREQLTRMREYTSMSELIEDKPKDPELLDYWERQKSTQITHIEMVWRQLNEDYYMLHFVHYRFSTIEKGLVLTILNNILDMDVTYVAYNHVCNTGVVIRFTSEHKEGIDYDIKEDEYYDHDTYAKRIETETGIPIHQLHRYMVDEVDMFITWDKSADMKMNEENLDKLKVMLDDTEEGSHE